MPSYTIIDVQPKEVSSTNASPVSLDVTELSAKDSVVRASRGNSEFTVKVKSNSHKNGPIVEPCPGPNKGHSKVFCMTQ